MHSEEGKIKAAASREKRKITMRKNRNIKYRTAFYAINNNTGVTSQQLASHLQTDSTSINSALRMMRMEKPCPILKVGEIPATNGGNKNQHLYIWTLPIGAE